MLCHEENFHFVWTLDLGFMLQYVFLLKHAPFLTENSELDTNSSLCFEFHDAVLGLHASKAIMFTNFILVD